MHSSTPAENFAAVRLLDAGGVLEAINDAPRTSWRSCGAADDHQCGAYHVDGLAACWGRLSIGNMRHCAIYRVEMRRSPCDRSCKNAHDINLAAKTHVEAWDGDETSQNAPDDERLD